MKGESRLSMGEAYLKIAFRQPGCPICRLKQEVMDRYIFSLLWENVNDVNTRIHLVRSLGFCSEHTWQLYHTEINRFGSGLGISIIYEDLTRYVMVGLRDYEARLPSNAPNRPRWWQRVWTRLRAVLGRSRPIARPGGILPVEPCRVCVHGADSEARYMHWLIEGCTDAAFRGWYAASDGLCLPHLRLVLEQAAQTESDVARFLTDTAAVKLEALATDLAEYARKHAWQYRHEPKLDAEQTSPLRASRFFSGSNEESGTR